MSHRTEVLLQLPNLEDLCCVNCQMNPDVMQHPIIKSLYHCQILTCRLIIDSVTCCIASPAIQKNISNLIHVIVSKQFFMTGKLQRHLAKLKMEFNDPEPVFPKIYEACLKYTFTFKLAPQWNLIGKSLYMFGNIFASSSNFDAVEWNIKLKDNYNPKLELKPVKINLFPLTLEYLGVPPRVVDNFKRNPEFNTIDSVFLTNATVYVLPRLTVGRVVSVSKKIPEICPFNKYEDLRRHWKNMYSIRLPKSDANILYYEVSFSVEPNQLFTYPEMCIYAKMPDYFVCNNKNEVASRFVKDLYEKIRSVCGTPIKVSQLYTEPDVQYSCRAVQQVKKISNNEKSVSCASTSSYFGLPKVNQALRNRPVERINMASDLKITGLNKMSETMKNHTEKVLAIMNGQKKRKTDSDGEKPKSNRKKVKKSCFGPEDEDSPITYEDTVVDNTGDICSYYDIPSMNSEYLKSLSKKENSGPAKETVSLQSKSETSSDTASTKSSYSRRSSDGKPVIKSIENVCFDLANLKKITNLKELNDDIRLRVQEKFNSEPPKEKIYKHDEKLYEDIDRIKTENSNYQSENIALFESIINKHNNTENKGNYTDSGKFSSKSQSTTTLSEVLSKNSSFSELTSDHSGVSKSSIESKGNKSESSDFKSFLANFDKYNIDGKPDNEIESLVYEKIENTPCSHKKLLENDKRKKEALEALKKLKEEMNFCDSEEIIVSPELSPSLLSSKKTQKSKKFSGQEGDTGNFENSESNQSNKNLQNTNSHQSPSSNFIMDSDFDKTDEFKGKEVNNDSLSNYYFQLFSPTNINDTSNDNLKKSKLIRSPILGSPLTSNNKTFTTCSHMLKSPTLLKTPRFDSINLTNSILENTEILQCTPDFSISTLNVNNESVNCSRQIETDSLITAIDNQSIRNQDPLLEFQKSGDFHSILSQSSHESNSSIHEIYKFACMESLTFNNSMN